MRDIGWRTVYLQGDDARQLIDEGYCEICLVAAREWAEPDKLGNVEVYGEYDCDGNLTGLVCPTCVGLRQTEVDDAGRDVDVRRARACDDIGCAAKARRTEKCEGCPFLEQALACAAHVLRLGRCQGCTEWTVKDHLSFCPRVF
jgi:hypothetical protein